MAFTLTNPRIEQEATDRGVTSVTPIDAVFANHPDEVDTPRPSETPKERTARFTEIDRLLNEIHATITDEDRAFDYNA